MQSVREERAGAAAPDRPGPARATGAEPAGVTGSPLPFSPAQLVFLQRSAGNRAVVTALRGGRVRTVQRHTLRPTVPDRLKPRPLDKRGDPWKLEDFLDAATKDRLGENLMRMIPADASPSPPERVEALFSNMKAVSPSGMGEYAHAAALVHDDGEVLFNVEHQDYYNDDGTVNREKVQSTIVHECMHAVSANHTGLQHFNDLLLKDASFRERPDEALTDYFAIEVYKAVFGQPANYVTGYWLPTEGKVQTGLDPSKTGQAKDVDLPVTWTSEMVPILREVLGVDDEALKEMYFKSPEKFGTAVASKADEIRRRWREVRGETAWRDQGVMTDLHQERLLHQAILNAREQLLVAGSDNEWPKIVKDRMAADAGIPTNKTAMFPGPVAIKKAVNQALGPSLPERLQPRSQPGPPIAATPGTGGGPPPPPGGSSPPLNSAPSRGGTGVSITEVLASKSKPLNNVKGFSYDAAVNNILAEKAKNKQSKLATTWALPGTERLEEIPAPQTIRDGYQALASKLGVEAHSKYDLTAPGVVSVIGHPHAKTVNAESRIEFENLNPTTKVVSPNMAAVVDPTRLAPGALTDTDQFSPAAEERAAEAFSKSYSIMAQNTNVGVEINAERASFTDLIHEAGHGYEAAELPLHIREGLIEVWASMVSQQILDEHRDARFAYTYNPTYSHFTVGAQRLIAALGLRTMASFFFQDEAPKETLRKAVAAVTDAVSAPQITDDLWSADYPAAFNRGMASLKLPSTTKPAATTTVAANAAPKSDEATALYDARRVSFETVLESKRAGLEAHGLTPGADMTDVALAWNDRYGTEVMEQRLALLYTHLKETTGPAHEATLELVNGHEIAIAKATNETQETVRKRVETLAPRSAVLDDTPPDSVIRHRAGRQFTVVGPPGEEDWGYGAVLVVTALDTGQKTLLTPRALPQYELIKRA